MRVRLRGFQRGFEANGGICRAIGGLCAFVGGVEKAQFDRVHVELFGEFVHHAFDGKGGHGRARGTVGRGFGAVCDHFPADRLEIFQIIGRKAAHGAERAIHGVKRA